MSVVLIVTIFVALAAFLAALRANPRWWLTQHLFSSWGPRTDTALMTRRELFADALKFVVLAVATFGAWLAVILVGEFLAIDPTNGRWAATTLMVLGFMLFILAGTSLLGALILLLHGIFRRRGYVPPSIPKGPDARRRRPYAG